MKHYHDRYFGITVPGARRVGVLYGKPVWRFPVVIRDTSRAASPWGTLDDMCDPPTVRLDILAHSAADAADYAQGLYPGPCVEIIVAGPKAGIAARCWRGWEGAIGAAMLAERPVARQLPLL